MTRKELLKKYNNFETREDFIRSIKDLVIKSNLEAEEYGKQRQKELEEYFRNRRIELRKKYPQIFKA